jgi:ribosome modulation factor
LREFNDDELRRWIREGKTQTEVAKIVGLSTSRISERCKRLRIRSSSNRGRPAGISGPGKLLCPCCGTKVAPEKLSIDVLKTQPEGLPDDD